MKFHFVVLAWIPFRAGSWAEARIVVNKAGQALSADVGGEKLVHVGCWAHARREFADAVKVNPKELNEGILEQPRLAVQEAMERRQIAVPAW